MARLTPVYRLPYIDDPNEVLTGQIERTRFVAIDRQLESLFTFLGNGIIAGWDLIVDRENNKNIIINRGSGVISSVAAATTGEIYIDDLKPNSKNYIYAKLTGTTTYTAKADFFSSTQQFESKIYLCLGAAITDQEGNITISNENRKELELINQVASIISRHVHTGEPGEPSKIDLFNHVKGVLSTANIDDIDASKITSGIFDKNRFRISHNDLLDKGTLSHEDLDFLVDKLQKINKILFGDIMSANLIQLMISMKHVWQNFDDYMINFLSVTPGVGNNTFLSENSFIDINSTTAEIDYDNNKIKGMFIKANEIGQISINSLNEWSSGTYNSNFITILDNSRAYGYGFGQSSNYFDVIQTNFENNFNSEKPIFGFPGSLIGWGVSDISGNSFEETFPENQYGYGYGWEYTNGFPENLSSTIVTLNPSSASLLMFESPNNNYINEVPQTKLFKPSTNDSQTLMRDFLFQLSNQSSNPNEKTRSSSINNSNISLSDNLYSFIVGRNEKTNQSIFVRSDISAMYTTWERPFDLSLDNYIFFTLQQNVPNNDPLLYEENFDPNWRFDHSFSLYLEFTVGKVRYIYQYKENKLQNFKFFDRNIKYFGDQISTLPVNGITPAKVVIGAEVNAKNSIDPSKNLLFAGSYNFEESFNYNLTPQQSTSSEPTFDILVKNLTGIFLVSSNGNRNDTSHNDDKYRRIREFGPIEKIQGKRIGMDPNLYINEEPASSMEVFIQKIYISGSIGFTSDIERNQISNITITFPEPVDFNSISWNSQEPSDSLIYIQIEKIGDGNGYLNLPIYSNKGHEIIERSILNLPNNISGYRESGSNFPESFKNTKKIRLRVVLLPSKDSIVAPSISSIIINYNSQTSSGEYKIYTQDQWSNALNSQNLKLNNGNVSIFDFSRTSNVIYGSEGKVVELNYTTNQEWVDQKYIYTGTDLPQTSEQILSGISSRISGKVTDLKILEDSRIAFLDRESSRVIISKFDPSKLNLDGSLGNLTPDIILQSEFAWNNTVSELRKPKYAEKARMVSAYFNEELEEHGILYIVFSHELDCWKKGIKIKPISEWNIDPSKFLIRNQGRAHNLLDVKQILVADRGVIAFILDGKTSNLLKSLTSPKIEISLDPIENQSVSGDFISGPDRCIKFSFENNSIESNSRIEKEIIKVGRTVPSKANRNYNLIFMPIKGIIAFDFDSNQNMYFIKKRRPYIWDNNENGFVKENEVWFGKVNTNINFSSWDMTQNNIDDAEFKDGEPYFFTNNIYGDRGSIEVLDDYLLMCISGQKQIFLSRLKKDSSSIFSSPQLIPIPKDGTFPMSARFDKANFKKENESDYSGIYVALSDINSESSSISKSRIIRIEDDGQKIVWEWGKKNPLVTNSSFSSVINDVRVLKFGENNSVILST